MEVEESSACFRDRVVAQIDMLANVPLVVTAHDQPSDGGWLR